MLPWPQLSLPAGSLHLPSVGGGLGGRGEGDPRGEGRIAEMEQEKRLRSRLLVPPELVGMELVGMGEASQWERLQGSRAGGLSCRGPHRWAGGWGSCKGATWALWGRCARPGVSGACSLRHRGRRGGQARAQRRPRILRGLSVGPVQLPQRGREVRSAVPAESQLCLAAALREGRRGWVALAARLGSCLGTTSGLGGPDLLRISMAGGEGAAGTRAPQLQGLGRAALKETCGVWRTPTAHRLQGLAGLLGGRGLEKVPWSFPCWDPPAAPVARPTLQSAKLRP